MKKLKRLVPSPSMGVAMLALCIALSGSAYAAAKINGKNIKNRSIAGSKLKKNTLGANEIKESSIAGKLPTVPSATNAANATNATHANAAGELDGFVKFGQRQGLGTGETEVYNSGKVRITQACDGAGATTVRAYTLVDNSSMAAYGNSSDTNDDDVDVADGAVTISSADEERDFVYAEPGGQVVTAQFISAEQPGLASGGCLLAGMVIAR